MKRTFHLASLLRKSGSGSSNTANRSANLNMIFYVLIGVAIAGLLGWVGLKFENFQLMLGDPVSFCGVLTFAGTILAIFLMIPQMLNHMYMSDDLMILLTMPYTMPQIITARIINLSGIIFLISAVSSLPFAITSGITLGMGAGYYLGAFLAFICIPIIVISVVGIVLMLIMYFVKGIRNKDTLKIIGAVVVMALCAAYMFINSSGSNLSVLTQNAIHAVSGYTDIMPINFALKSLMGGNGGLIAVLEIFAITAAFALVFGLLVSKIYLPGALAMQETAGHRGTLTDAEFTKKCRRKSVMKAYVIKDFRLVKRDPAYLMRGILYPLGMPLIILITFMFMQKTELIGFKSLAQFGPAFALSWTISYSWLITTLAGCTNVIPASCMSREGDMIQILKQTPVDHKLILKAKMISSMITSVIGSTTYIVVGGLLLVVAGYLPIWCMIPALLVNAGLLVIYTSLSMLHDIRNPRFVWDNEADMLKKCGQDPLTIVLLIVGIIAPMVYMLLAMIMFSTVLNLLISGALVLVIILGGVLLYNAMLKTGCKKMAKY